jgi:hypothetical protein
MVDGFSSEWVDGLRRNLQHLLLRREAVSSQTLVSRTHSLQLCRLMTVAQADGLPPVGLDTLLQAGCHVAAWNETTIPR